MFEIAGEPRLDLNGRHPLGVEALRDDVSARSVPDRECCVPPQNRELGGYVVRARGPGHRRLRHPGEEATALRGAAASRSKRGVPVTVSNLDLARLRLTVRAGWVAGHSRPGSPAYVMSRVRPNL